MSIQQLDSITPLLKLIKKNIRRWMIHIFIIYFGLITTVIVAGYDSSGGGGQGSNGNSSTIRVKVAAGVFLFLIFVLLIFYIKNIRKNAVLKRTIQDYGEVESIDVFSLPYRRVLFLSRIILVLDIFFWPITFPFKFVFWHYYRRLKKRFNKLRKMVIKGEKKVNVTSIESDPFYDFLMREGLYKSQGSGEETGSDEVVEEDKTTTEEDKSKETTEEPKEKESKEGA